MNRMVKNGGRLMALLLVAACGLMAAPEAARADGDHHEADGLVLRQNGVDIVTVWQGVVTGEIEIHHDETTAPIAVIFLDDDGDEFVPDDPDYSLGWLIGDPDLVALNLVGDWVFTLTALEHDHHRKRDGDHDETTLTLSLMHDGHSDFTSPPIPVHIEHEHGHLEADGLVLRQNGVDIATFWQGVVTGQIMVPHGSTGDAIDVIFLDPDGDEFVPADPDFSLGWALGDLGLADFALVGDWSFTLTGNLDGATTLTLSLMHDGHSDFTSDPLAVVVTGPTASPLLPERLALLGNYPNPFNPMTTLRFSLPAAAGVHLAVFDAAGRRVRTLMAGEVLPAGVNEVAWDGRDERGRSVGAGMYLGRLQVAGEQRALAMTLVK